MPRPVATTGVRPLCGLGSTPGHMGKTVAPTTPTQSVGGRGTSQWAPHEWRGGGGGAERSVVGGGGAWGIMAGARGGGACVLKQRSQAGVAVPGLRRGVSVRKLTVQAAEVAARDFSLCGLHDAPQAPFPGGTAAVLSPAQLAQQRLCTHCPAWQQTCGHYHMRARRSWEVPPPPKGVPFPLGPGSQPVSVCEGVGNMTGVSRRSSCPTASPAGIRSRPLGKYPVSPSLG